MLNIMPDLELLGQSFPQQIVRLLGIVCQSVDAMRQDSNNDAWIKQMEW